ncbi:nitrate- and nitrite sensing domain-containing protein [Sphaerisporangium fuscum]|uniref:nitrate- and nitrite sensing domain-containing protein n=1 Tax=Sphaerisporangium fuscum TaxID=2835868 RepID=UPI001BDBB7F2|nr:nitrate- and nitrite sensing domain-containing protein [Sphaerisporangium fuscum]
MPTIVGVVLAGLRVVSSIDSVAAYQRNAAEAGIAAHLRDLGEQLGLERDRTVWYLATRQQKTALSNQRQVVDTGITTVRADLAKIDDGYGVRAVEDARQAANRLDAMPDIRKGGQPAKYTEVVTALLRLHDEISQSSEDPQLIGYARALSALARAKEEISEQRGTLIGALSRGVQFTPDSLEEFIASRSRQKAAINTFNVEAGGDNGRLLSQVLRGPQIIRAELTKSWAIALAGRNQPLQDDSGRGVSATVKQWFDDNTKTIGVLRQIETQMAASVATRAAALESAERRNAVIAGILILALVILVLATTILIARSLVRPLRRLRSEALEIAGTRLPGVVRHMRESGEGEVPDVQPILVGSHDEIGEVATAFDEVHRQALRLAAEESQLRGTVNAMFVNLSRRIQTLVERQISLIDGLERGEQDGGRLADLFKLDHLATRMRRNSENLLVLAGHEAARKRSQPAKLVDVVRASLSEVEDYERVSVKVHRNAAVLGHAANDVVHLIAELVENALAFSPGNTRVVVSSSLVEGGGVLLAVSDSGIGMAPGEIAEANRKLADPPVIDASVSRRMGLFVVGRLARRHDIRVQLRPGDSAGVIAMMLFPPQLISMTAGRGPALPQRGTATADAPTPAFGAAGPATGGSPFGGPGSGRSFNGGSASPYNGGGAPAYDGGGSAAPFNGAGRPPAFDNPAGPMTPGPVGAFGGPAPAGPVPDFPDPVQAAGESALFGPWTGPAVPSGPATGPQHMPSGPGTGPQHMPSGPGTGPQHTPSGPSAPAGPATGQGAPSAPAGPAVPSTGPAGPSTGPGGPSTGPAPRRPGAPQRTSPAERPGSPAEPVAPSGPAVRPPEPSTPLEHGDEFLPIFASVESAWFRRPDPQEIAAQARAQKSSAEAPEASHDEAPREAAAGEGWGSTADTGWRAANAVKEPALGGITSAGLPKRTPKANLVPGSVSPPPAPKSAPAAPAPRPEVVAEQVRNRMARFQQGIQRGRADISQARNRDTDHPRVD